jgi:hypothetical protein
VFGPRMKTIGKSLPRVTLPIVTWRGGIDASFIRRLPPVIRLLYAQITGGGAASLPVSP